MNLNFTSMSLVRSPACGHRESQRLFTRETHIMNGFKILQSSYSLPNVSNGDDLKPSCEPCHFAC